jgi:hypothetical protein
VREEVKVVELDRFQQGMALTALVEHRNQQIADGKCVKNTDELIREIFDAPTKRRKVRVRDER